MWWYREGNKEQGWRRVGVLSKHCSHTCVISGFWMSNWMSNLSSDLIVFNTPTPCIVWIFQKLLLWPSKNKHEFSLRSRQWMWKSIALHHTMYSSFAHTHRCGQSSKVVKPSLLHPWGMMFFDVCLWCFTNVMQQHFFQIHAIHHGIQLLKTSHVDMAKSCMSKHHTFIQRICNVCHVFVHLHIKKVQVLISSLLPQQLLEHRWPYNHPCQQIPLWNFSNEFTHKDEIILHFWYMKNLGDGCMWQFASHLHCGFDVPFINGLQNGVIPHEHLPWGNAFIRGKPCWRLWFRCNIDYGVIDIINYVVD